MDRRRFAQMLAAGAGPFLIPARGAAPTAAHGVMSGDVLADRAIVWSRADRDARLLVEWSTTESMRDARRVRGPMALASTGYTARLDLRGLPAGQTIFYRARFADERDARLLGEPVAGQFRTPSVQPRDIRFFWSGDTCGQGFGINPEIGGMRIYETMRRGEPDFFLHSGDTIYADVPIPAEIKLKDGTVWKNVTTEAKSKVAETLDEYRGNYLYNLMDENLRRFNADIPQIWQWDDHETMNNWSPGTDLTANPAYREKNIRVLAARSRQAFLEHSPIRFGETAGAKIYRKIPYGPLLDVFVLDMRTYRAANGYNRQTVESDETTYLGRPQLEWLERDLRESKATWKVVASDMPLGVIVTDGTDKQGRPKFENSANGPGAPLGRELEIARLLRAMQRSGVRNVVWLTTDIHYTAAHYFDPARAKFTEFDPFWEFVSGPLNAGTFGPAEPDETFGVDVKFQKHPPAGQGGMAPSQGMQFYGEVRIEAKSRAMTVVLRDMTGAALFSKELAARVG